MTGSVRHGPGFVSCVPGNMGLKDLSRSTILDVVGESRSTWIEVITPTMEELSERFVDEMDVIRGKTPSYFDDLFLRRNLYRRVGFPTNQLQCNENLLPFEFLMGAGEGIKFNDIKTEVNETLQENIRYQKTHILWKNFGRSRLPRECKLDNENKSASVAPRAHLEIPNQGAFPTWISSEHVSSGKNWTKVLVPNGDGLFIFDGGRNRHYFSDIEEGNGAENSPPDEEECCKSFWFAHKDSIVDTDIRHILLAPSIEGIYYLESLGDIYEIEVVE